MAVFWCSFAVLKKLYIDELMPPVDSIYHELIAREVAALLQDWHFGEAFSYFAVGNPAYRFLLGIFYGVTDAPELITYTLNGALGFIGLLALLEIACIQTQCEKLPAMPLLACMLLPSGLLWSTGNLKEGPVLWGICMMLYWSCGADRISVTRVPGSQSQFEQRRIGLPLLGMLTVGLLRPHIAMLWLMPISLSMTKRSQSKSFVLIAGAGVLASIFLLKTMVPELYHATMSEGVTSSLNSKHQELTDNNNLVSSHFAGSKPTPVLTGVLLILFRPWPTEVASLGELLAGLEMWFLATLGLASWYRSTNKRQLMKQVNFLTLLFALLLLGFLFSYMYNMGLVARQRLMAMPAVLSIYFWPVFCRTALLKQRSASRREVSRGKINRNQVRPRFATGVAHA